MSKDKGQDEAVRVQRRRLADYVLDEKNANAGSERGRRLIRDSFAELGAGRSLLVDREGRVIAGNHSLAGAQQAGFDDVIEIETDERARRLALADNRSNELNLTWDAPVLTENAGLLDGLFRDDEIEDLLSDDEVRQMVNDQVAAGVTKSRRMSDRKKQIAPVLYVDEIAIFERAVKATGIDNRGQAVLAICRHYLDTHGGADDDEAG